MIWDVEKTGIWTVPCNLLDCTKTAISGLKPDWEATLDAAIARVKASAQLRTATVAWVRRASHPAGCRAWHIFDWVGSLQPAHRTTQFDGRYT